ncbi:hypothetical protein HYU16_02185 [Candidatus Woesearchaeota archaeon]|nr:hypothetical protein [Candidatus Woesearchaeota archaeon]
MAISEDEVRKSFARVKEDILQLKRSVNKQAFAGEETGRALGNLLQKDEFYAFIKRLGSKIEELENQFPSKSDSEDVQELASELREEISGLRKAVERKDELAGEIQQVRKLQGKVLELEGLSIPKPEFSREISRLKAELSSLRSETSAKSSELSSSASSLAGSLAKLTKDLTDFGARLNSLATRAVVKDDISSFTERIESSSQEMSRGFASLKRDFDKKAHDVDRKVSFVGSFEDKLSSLGEKLASAETAIAAINESLSRKFIDKHNFEKSVAELRSKLNETRQLVDSSMSEVNLDDYVTRRSLKQQLSSVSDSVPAAVDSALSSKLSSVEEQLRSLKSQLDSLQRASGQRHTRDISKLREEIERFSSEFVQFSDFASKLDRLQKSSEDAWNDAKKEMKRQRELLEERLRSLESHYRSSNDSLKAELDELRSQTKSLSKADAAAKVEMAKISTSAAKVAAKTATELLEEAGEEERAVRKPGKGLSPLAVSIVIVALLILGSLAYVVLKGQEAGVTPTNITQNISLPEEAPAEAAPQPQPTPVPGAEAAEQIVEEAEVVEVTPPAEAEEIAAANITVPEAPAELVANVSENISVAVPNVSVESVPVTEDKNKKCKEELECTKRSDSGYWFDCYFDESLMDCRCFVGSIEKCPQLLVENESVAASAPPAEGAKEEEKGKTPGLRYYGAVAFVVLVVLFFAYRMLFVKEEKTEKATEQQREKGKEQKESKSEKAAAKKQEKEKEKPAKAESEDEDVIDLEEFFEKKS